MKLDSIAAFMQQEAGEAPSEQPELESTELTGAEADDHEVLEDEDDHDQEYETSEDDDGEESELEAYTVKVNGEELTVNRDELINGYQRDADYRHKTMTLAEERKAFEASKQKLDEKLTELDSFIERKTSELTEELMLSNPGEYLKRKAEIEKAEKAAQTAKAERAKEIEAQKAEYVQHEVDALVQAMGDKWTPELRNKDMKRATRYLDSLGVSEDEISSITDHRLWRVIFDAAKSQDFAKTASKVKEQKRSAPKTVKPGQKLPPSERKRQELKDKVSNSGTRKGRIDALAQLIQG